MDSAEWLDQQIANQLANAARLGVKLDANAPGSMLAPLRNLLARRAALPAPGPMPLPIQAPSGGLGGFPVAQAGLGVSAPPLMERVEDTARKHGGLLVLAGLALSVLALRRRR
jgi:hypothetical protein